MTNSTPLRISLIRVFPILVLAVGALSIVHVSLSPMVARDKAEGARKLSVRASDAAEVARLEGRLVETLEMSALAEASHSCAKASVATAEAWDADPVWTTGASRAWALEAQAWREACDAWDVVAKPARDQRRKMEQ